MTQEHIRLFGAPWCPDCKRSKQFLNEQRIPYQWHDIDEDEEARAYVQQVNNGKQIIPTIASSYCLRGLIVLFPSPLPCRTRIFLRHTLEASSLITHAAQLIVVLVSFEASKNRTIFIETHRSGNHAHSTTKVL
jgi:glutaredoxin